MMHAVYLQQGRSLCALGSDPAAQLAALRAGNIGPLQRRSLPAFVDRLSIPYFAIDEKRATNDIVHSMIAQLQPLPHPSTALLLGSTSFNIDENELQYRQALQRDPQQAVPMPLPGYSLLLEKLATQLQLRGPCLAFNTACTASANALLVARDLIASGSVQQALVIGIERYNLTTVAGFSGLQLLSDETIRPFDHCRSGIVLGETISCVLLGRAPSAIAIAGGANACDSHSVTGANPDGSSIASVIRLAIENAGSSNAAIRGIKAHGTASPLNDAAEAAGLRRVFATMPPLTALKGYIGHTLGACGVLETWLCAQALRAGFWPAAAGYGQYCEDLAVQPLTQSVSIDSGDYLLNFFGFGGNNSALVLRYTADKTP